MYELGRVKYSLVFFRSALGIHEVNFFSQMGCFGLYPFPVVVWGILKGYMIFKGSVVCTRGRCPKVQRCYASKQLGLKLKTDRPEQLPSSALFPKAIVLKFFFFFQWDPSSTGQIRSDHSQTGLVASVTSHSSKEERKKSSLCGCG